MTDAPRHYQPGDVSHARAAEIAAIYVELEDDPDYPGADKSELAAALATAHDRLMAAARPARALAYLLAGMAPPNGPAEPAPADRPHPPPPPGDGAADPADLVGSATGARYVAPPGRPRRFADDWLRHGRACSRATGGPCDCGLEPALELDHARGPARADRLSAELEATRAELRGTRAALTWARRPESAARWHIVTGHKGALAIGACGRTIPDGPRARVPWPGRGGAPARVCAVCLQRFPQGAPT